MVFCAVLVEGTVHLKSKWTQYLLSTMLSVLLVSAMFDFYEYECVPSKNLSF